MNQNEILEINEYFKNKTYNLETELLAQLTPQEITELQKEGEEELK